MKTTLVLLVAACMLTAYMIDAMTAKERRQQERREEKQAEREREAKKEAKKKAKEMERRNEEANALCMPLKAMMIAQSDEICMFRRWQLNEIMERGANFTCFEDLKNSLFEKYDNFTKMMMGNGTDGMGEDWGDMMAGLGDMMEGMTGDNADQCDKECRKQRRKDAKKAAKPSGGDEEEEQEEEPDFGVEFDLGMEEFLKAVNVSDIDGLKAITFRQMINSLGKCNKCAKKDDGCLRLNAWLGTKLKMAHMMMGAIEMNNGTCTGVQDVLMSTMMSMMGDMMEDDS